ncbi:hypothetical protein Dsin_019186 [Dipteronia sinensis]|uniref:BHLH domain-containing protein n=1 Tax=Dipteronia sinensis TaxID=43782 RepID=A0AAE0A6P6_9ROSI|nr:hypothetical protein Dsin_019186 [Dipteronia sinensis]
MESDLQQHHPHHLHDHQHQHQQRQLNSGGLTRYQSAPSSYFSSFMDRDMCEDFLTRPPSPETERILAKYLSNGSGNSSETNNNASDQNIGLIRQNSPVTEKLMEAEQQQQTTSMNNNRTGIVQQQRNFSASRSFYQNQSQHPNSVSGMDYGAINSVGMDRFPPTKMGNSSNLIRHSSSPAGLFANMEIENGYVVMKGMGDYGNSNNNREASFASAGRPPTSSSGPMSPISELPNKGNTGGGGGVGGGFIEDHSNSYSSGFPVDSWDETSIMSDNVTGVKRLREDDRTLSAGLIASETQNMDARPPPLLAHHLSLPKDLNAIEKLLQFQDSVPCKIRAKRGCATHPRSIAERVRRTKISERMRKLQDLVPNMDKVYIIFFTCICCILLSLCFLYICNMKQTNTADMLDLAVDYVKELQDQVKVCFNQPLNQYKFIAFSSSLISSVSTDICILFSFSYDLSRYFRLCGHCASRAACCLC